MGEPNLNPDWAGKTDIKYTFGTITVILWLIFLGVVISIILIQEVIGRYMLQLIYGEYHYVCILNGSAMWVCVESKCWVGKAEEKEM